LEHRNRKHKKKEKQKRKEKELCSALKGRKRKKPTRRISLRHIFSLYHYENDSIVQKK